MVEGALKNMTEYEVDLLNSKKSIDIEDMKERQARKLLQSTIHIFYQIHICKKLLSFTDCETYLSLRLTWIP